MRGRGQLMRGAIAIGTSATRLLCLTLRMPALWRPSADKRHPVLTPADLLIGSCLSNCPLARPQHVGTGERMLLSAVSTPASGRCRCLQARAALAARSFSLQLSASNAHPLLPSLPAPSPPPTGLFLASLAVHLHSQAQRFVPEPLSFATQLLQSVLPEGAAPAPAPSHQRALAPGQPRWLAVSASDEGAADLPATEADIAPLELAQVLGGSGSDAYWASAAFKTSAAAAAVRLVLRQAELLGGNAALPEILAPALEALRAIVAAADGSAQQQQQQDGAQPPARKKQRGKQQKQAAAAAAPAAARAAVVAPGLAALCLRAVEALESAAAAAQGARRPLYNVHLLKVAEKKQVRAGNDVDTLVAL